MGSVSVDTRELMDIVHRFEERGRNVSRLTPAIAEIFVSGVSDVYDAEGPGWKDLAGSTQRARRGSSYKILQDSGVMAGSTTAIYGSDWAGAKAGASYADYHARGNANLPRRNPFDLGPFLDEVLDETEDLLLRELDA
jgi:phage gpG-like protein